MSIRVALHHVTHYRYDRPVALSPHLVRLRPAPHCRTPVLSYSLKIEPASHFLNWMQDPYSNYQARLVFPQVIRELKIEVDLVAQMTAINPFDFFVEPGAEAFPFEYEAALKRDLTPFLEAMPPGPLLRDYLATIDRRGRRSVDFVVEVNSRLREHIGYVIRMEPGVQTPEETLALRKGSCRDSAWLLVQLFRHMGLASRFVSGYLIQLSPDQKPLEGPAGPVDDFTDLHAWAEVYLPGAGWVGLDPTSGLLASEGHLPLAATAMPSDAAPVSGMIDDCETELDVRMTVTRVHEDPRVTKPYTSRTWSEIEDLGRQVDAALDRGDVRLMMGGEPTFVSIDDMDGEEWNTAAQGPHKRERAGVLVRRLRDRFASGGFLHFGQGKWYPGESLPRWALGLYWRRDGQPIWTDQGLVAADATDYGVTHSHAMAFVHELAQRLGVDPEHALPGYEDTWYYLWKERRLPGNVDPFDSRLKDPEERARLAKVFEQGLDRVVGYALPLRRSPGPDGSRWASGAWFFRPERMYLVPGDSPMGYRLPLDSLPWVRPEEFEFHIDLDPFALRRRLPDRSSLSRQRAIPGADGPIVHPAIVEQLLVDDEQPGEGEHRPVVLRAGAGGGNGRRTGTGTGDAGLTTMPSVGRGASGVVRTALCVEARMGKLMVFVPPQRYLEDYLDLIARIEDTAAALAMPVMVEGYAPPWDHRLRVIKVTPDPGVIEVNIHPAGNWNELVQNTAALYEEARLSRLGAEKFMLDGRHTGTGGGNHIVLGGPTPADSPLLRRPDVLRSLLGYWNNHPSLSYLFSGMFVGATSQAPRFDEGRPESLHEMEIAFSQIPNPPELGGPTAPSPTWLVDRVFRHLLTDVTGNTHRAEFCIDKLYSPDSSTGRLGLVELRAFEMPPHHQMSLVQQLLLRTLIAHFWNKPFQHRLVRWGTELHDRFMLPHFVQQDLDDVLYELRQAGHPLRAEWFAPHLEFRFPLYGEVTHRGIHLQLRQAIEPWNVLGEEPASGGTTRFVDSSVERLEVKVSGMTDTRHVIACNGRPLPLHPTGVNGQFVAGVRYRAWQPPSCLHPTVPVHSPLILDVVDTWVGRSIGGCTYHVSHPGGRNYQQFPVNALEAQSRRIARFFKFGHTPGPMAVAPEPPSAMYPFTLDLRRPTA